MKMQLVTKRGLFATLKAVLTVMFIYFTFGYVLGYMNSPITIYELDTKQQSKFEDILTSHGITYKGEIDFVATKPDKKIYIQVAFSIPNEETKKREFGAYNAINDNYPKYVITLDKMTYEYDGIKHINLIDFLLDDNF